MSQITIKLLAGLAGWIFGCYTYPLITGRRDWKAATNDAFMATAYTIMLIFLLP